jgi:ribonuclease-3
LTATEGPDHRRRFNVDVMVGGVSAGNAQGRSKKEAEQQAAKAALTKFRSPVDSHEA